MFSSHELRQKTRIKALRGAEIEQPIAGVTEMPRIKEEMKHPVDGREIQRLVTLCNVLESCLSSLPRSTSTTSALTIINHHDISNNRQIRILLHYFTIKQKEKTRLTYAYNHTLWTNTPAEKNSPLADAAPEVTIITRNVTQEE